MPGSFLQPLSRTRISTLLASLWLEAMIVVDQKKSDEAAVFFEGLAARDPEIDTTQQASIEVDKAILDIRGVRRDEGISCDR